MNKEIFLDFASERKKGPKWNNFVKNRDLRMIQESKYARKTNKELISITLRFPQNPTYIRWG